MTADYKTLLQQKAELEAKIAATLKAEKGGVIAKVRELVEQFGLTQDDIFSTGKAKSASIGVAKYRDPCLLYTSPSPRDVEESRMPSSA